MNRFTRIVCNTLSLQLFVSLISLPVIIAWGLPLSLLSPLGIIIFGPLLTLFLFICALLFVSQLCGVPNGWLVMLLEGLSIGWRMCAPTWLDHFLYGFAMPPWWVLVAVPVVTLGVMHLRCVHHSQNVGWACLLD